MTRVQNMAYCTFCYNLFRLRRRIHYMCRDNQTDMQHLCYNPMRNSNWNPNLRHDIPNRIHSMFWSKNIRYKNPNHCCHRHHPCDSRYIRLFCRHP